MERKFNNEFERFLKERADQYRLYPSTRVWNGIYGALHTRRRWFGLGLALLLLNGLFVTILITNTAKETTNIATKPSVQKQVPASGVHIPVTQDSRTSSIQKKYH